MFRVFQLDEYRHIISKWDNSIYSIAQKIAEDLIEQPYSGKPLGYEFLREKKIGGFRIYYLIYEDLKLVLLVQAGTKKNQEVAIDSVKSHLDEYRALAEELIFS